MKRKIFASLFILVAASVFAQQHVSVPLDDPVYRVIENALIQNYIRPLPTAKPYSLATVLSALREMVQSPRISPLEKKAAEGLIARFEASKTQPWYQIGGYRYDSEAEAAKAAAESEQTESEQTESEQTESEQTESEQTESENRNRQNRNRQNRNRQNRNRQNRNRQNRNRQNRSRLKKSRFSPLLKRLSAINRHSILALTTKPELFLPKIGCRLVFRATSPSFFPIVFKWRSALRR